MSRIRIMEAHLKKKIRGVGLSAPVINASDVGNWMGARKQDQHAFSNRKAYTAAFESCWI